VGKVHAVDRSYFSPLGAEQGEQLQQALQVLLAAHGGPE
jgi:hypothetical protein